MTTRFKGWTMYIWTMYIWCILHGIFGREITRDGSVVNMWGFYGAWHPSGLAWKKYLIKRINCEVRSGTRKKLPQEKRFVGMEVIKSYVCLKFPKSAWSAVEIVVAVVPVCSRLVVAMCMCTRRVRWATTIPSRITINIRGWSGSEYVLKPESIWTSSCSCSCVDRQSQSLYQS